MAETHPFGNFVPANSKYLLLGSFTTKPYTGYEWFYANKRNQFWPILEEVYDKELKTKVKMQKLFVDLQMALADIIYSCTRTQNSNLDMHLIDIVWNDSIREIFENHPIKRIYVTSRFVEGKFKSLFKEVLESYPEVEVTYLPSPSPRYAAMSKLKKIEIYKSLLPQL